MNKNKIIQRVIDFLIKLQTKEVTTLHHKRQPQTRGTQQAEQTTQTSQPSDKPSSSSESLDDLTTTDKSSTTDKSHTANKLSIIEKLISTGEIIVAGRFISNIFPLSKKKGIIIACIIAVILFISIMVYQTTSFMNKSIETIETASSKIGLMDIESTKLYKREQKELIRIKKEKEQQEAEQEAIERVKKAQDAILALKAEYLNLREEYSKYIDIHGKPHQGITINNDIQAIITNYRSKQLKLIEKLEEYEYLIEHIQ